LPIRVAVTGINVHLIGTIVCFVCVFYTVLVSRAAIARDSLFSLIGIIDRLLAGRKIEGSRGDPREGSRVLNVDKSDACEGDENGSGGGTEAKLIFRRRGRRGRAGSFVEFPRDD